MDNAAARMNFVSAIYEQGVALEKKAVLDALPQEFAWLHREGLLHIHDLEGYRYVYNCCTPELHSYIKPELFRSAGVAGKIAEVFEGVKDLITNLAVCQTGGIGFASFDTDLAVLLDKAGVDFSVENQLLVQEHVTLFLHWVNTTRTRYCREPYYISLNLGLDTSAWGRCICQAILVGFLAQAMDFTRPNIIFKVSGKINAAEDAPNHDLFLLALRCTANRMVPTYLLVDSEANKNCCPERLGIMGCRTRVYQNCNGEEGTVGRGNIAYVSINLPALALASQTRPAFLAALAERMRQGMDILLVRQKTLRRTEVLGFIFQNRLWRQVDDIDELLRQGTYSIGFIGLAETVEILTGAKMHQSREAQELAYAIVSEMRKEIDLARSAAGLNFTLLATPGELISGRFVDADRKHFVHPVLSKGFYTNSFHIEVDAGLSVFDKISQEGKFHALCNGGSISYVEFTDAPMHNVLALADIIGFAVEQGVSYLGINFPLDICSECGCHGTFDQCPDCQSSQIKRIRRVSGYLEDVAYFTKGKTLETGKRQANPLDGSSHP